MTLTSLVKFEFLKMIRSFSLWGIFGGMMLIAALIFKWQLGSYSEQSHLALEQAGRVFGVSTEVIKPYWGWCLLLLTLVVPILCLLNISLERQRKYFGFWVTYGVSPFSLLACKAFTLFTMIAFLISMLSLIPLSLWLIASIDVGLTLSGALTVLLASLWILSISIWLSFLLNNPALYLLITYTAIGLICFFPVFMPFQAAKNFFIQLSFLNYAHNMMNGRLYLIDLLYFTVIISVMLLLSYFATKRSLSQTGMNY